ncbi:MAG: hypothetical protein PHH00_04050, partial [Candidatus Nanoarchaeia archaeon]|nr:hypothetical protein [Candidatus Nanoarchaeia archaeon]
MGLVEELYGKEDVSLRQIWQIPPFILFSPEAHFLGFKNVLQAISQRDNRFFVNNVRNNFFPDKSDGEVLEATRFAINRGILTLNELCVLNITENQVLLQDPIKSPYNPAELMAEAREKWIRAREGKGTSENHAPRDSKLMLEAYQAVRAWGLGHLILLIDEAPELTAYTFHQDQIDKWFQDRLEFKGPSPAEG